MLMGCWLVPSQPVRVSECTSVRDVVAHSHSDTIDTAVLEEGQLHAGARCSVQPEGDTGHRDRETTHEDTPAFLYPIAYR